MNMEKRHVRTLWSYATNTDIVQIGEYDTFRHLGKDALVPVGHSNIWVHLLYYVKHDRFHKTRLAANEHLTGLVPDF